MYLMLSVGGKAEGCSKLNKTSTFLQKSKSKPAKKSEKNLSIPYRQRQQQGILLPTSTPPAKPFIHILFLTSSQPDREHSKNLSGILKNKRFYFTLRLTLCKNTTYLRSQVLCLTVGKSTWISTEFMSNLLWECRNFLQPPIRFSSALLDEAEVSSPQRGIILSLLFLPPISELPKQNNFEVLGALIIGSYFINSLVS